VVPFEQLCLLCITATFENFFSFSFQKIIPSTGKADGSSNTKMAPQMSEDDIDDLIYFSRAGDQPELEESLTSLAGRENVSTADILLAAKDGGKSTCLHMAAGNGHLGQ
jgi:hypothetical protein